MSNIEHDDARFDGMRDAVFRDAMHSRAATDPQAMRWIELDTEVQTQARQIANAEADIEKRQNTNLDGLLNSYRHAKELRDTFAQTKRPWLFNRTYDRNLNELCRDVDALRKAYRRQLDYVSPEAIETVQARIEHLILDVGAKTRERQAIAMLPSEQRIEKEALVAAEDRIVQAVQPAPAQEPGEVYKRWTVMQSFTLDGNPQPILETNSAVVADRIFQQHAGNHVLDNDTYRMVAHVNWNNDGATPEFVRSEIFQSELEREAAILVAKLAERNAILEQARSRGITPEIARGQEIAI